MPEGEGERHIAARVLWQAFVDWKKYGHITEPGPVRHMKSLQAAAFRVARKHGYKTVREDILAFLAGERFLLLCQILGVDPEWMAKAVKGEAEVNVGDVIFFGDRGLMITP